MMLVLEGCLASSLGFSFLREFLTLMVVMDMTTFFNFGFDYDTRFGERLILNNLIFTDRVKVQSVSSTFKFTVGELVGNAMLDCQLASFAHGFVQDSPRPIPSQIIVTNLAERISYLGIMNSLEHHGGHTLYWGSPIAAFYPAIAYFDRLSIDVTNTEIAIRFPTEDWNLCAMLFNVISAMMPQGARISFDGGNQQHAVTYGAVSLRLISGGRSVNHAFSTRLVNPFFASAHIGRVSDVTIHIARVMFDTNIGNVRTHFYQASDKMSSVAIWYSRLFAIVQDKLKSRLPLSTNGATGTVPTAPIIEYW